MSTVSIPNRPFAAEPVTGFMLPDGVFEASFGQLRINAHFRTIGASSISNANIYIESVSDPGIIVTPITHPVAKLSPASHLLYWDADFTMASPGVHQVSFAIESAAGRVRIIKKIFVTRIAFNSATKTFRAITPEGTMDVRLTDMVQSKKQCCRKSIEPRTLDIRQDQNFINVLGKLLGLRVSDPSFAFCLPGYLFHDVEIVVTPTPAYPGKYGDLPFQDFWWKIILALIALILIIAAAVEGSKTGDEITTGQPAQGGNDVSTGQPPNCCGPEEQPAVQGGGNSYLVAGLVAAAAAVALIAVYSDIRDPFRRGEDNTDPAEDELTVAERLVSSIEYIEPVALGRPFGIRANWDYSRITTGSQYTFPARNETNTNSHVLSSYTITAPNIIHVYKREPFIVKGQFLGPNGEVFCGDQLYVNCILRGPQNQYRTFTLQDDGVYPDEIPKNGVYTGVFQFALEENPRGLWMVFVIAQDVNAAQPEMSPEQQSQYIGGLVLTHQLTISFEGGTCPLVPDGHVNVV